MEGRGGGMAGGGVTTSVLAASNREPSVEPTVSVCLVPVADVRRSSSDSSRTSSDSYPALDGGLGIELTSA